MTAISYQPQKDRMVVQIQPEPRPHCTNVGHFQICSDNFGKVKSLTIDSFMEELRAFKKGLHTVKLGGIWKGLKITESDIDEVRKELLNGLDERW